MLPDTDQAEYEALLQFLYLAPIGVAQIDPTGEIQMANPVCAQLLMPLTRDGALDNLFVALERICPDLRARVRDFPASEGSVCDAQLLRIALPDGGGSQMLSLSLIKIDASRLMAVLSDVTQSVRREHELRQHQAWIGSITGGVTDYAMMTLDHGGRIRSWNASIGKLTGFDAARAVGAGFDLFMPDGPLSRERMDARLRDALADGWSLDEGWRQRADGSRFWASCLLAPLDETRQLPDEERAYSYIVRDISEQRESNEALRQSVLCDHLTGLANRRAFFDAAEREIRRWQRSPQALSLVVIDADHFKRINDTHGHLAGDAVLRHLAAGLRATFRTTDLVARIGGEEFVALLPDTGLDGAVSVAERLCERIAAQTVEVDGTPIRYTVSAGVAAMEAGIDGIETLFRRADAALYVAKSTGRNRVERWAPPLTGVAPLAAIL